MKTDKNSIEINERDKRVIQIVTQLSDKELFGIECFLVGTRANLQEIEKSKESEA